MTVCEKLVKLMLVMFVVTSVAAIIGCESDDDDPVISIDPTTITIDAGVVTNLEVNASGGDGTYLWSVTDPTLGTIVGAGDTAIYSSAGTTGMNFITVSDGASNTVSSTVNQL